MKIMFFSVTSVLLFTWVFSAAAAPSSFYLQGQILKPNGTAVEAASVDFTLQVLSTNDECILLEETFNLNMSGTSGVFNLSVGTGLSTGAGGVANIEQSIDNTLAQLTGLSCNTGTVYDPQPGDTRKIRVTFNDGTGPVTLSEDHVLKSVPYAMYAGTLNGKAAHDFIQVNGISSGVTQSHLETVFDGGSNYDELIDLINGDSAVYTKFAASGANHLPSFTNAIPPVAPTAGEIWFNSDTSTLQYYDGSSTQTVGAGTVTSVVAGSGLSGGSITSSGTIAVATGGIINNHLASGIDASKITTGTLPIGVIPAGTDSSKLPLAGGTMTGDINFAGNNLLNTGYITMNPGSPLHLGAFNNAAQATLVSTFTVPADHAGKTWFNTDSSSLKYWDGSQVVDIASLTSSLPQYALLAGRAGGQSLSGGTAANENLTLDSTTSSTKGDVLISPNGGYVGVGTTAPENVLHIQQEGSGAYLLSKSYRDSVNSGGMIMQHARGTEAAPTVLLNDDRLGALYFAGYDGDEFLSRAIIDSRVEGTPTNNNLATALVFSNSTGASTASEKMRISSNGNVGIGTPTPQGLLSNNATNYGAIGTGLNNTQSLNWNNSIGTGWTASFTSAGIRGVSIATDDATTTSVPFIVSSGAYNSGAGTRASDLFTVKGDGKIGVGTASPTTKLQVDNDTDVTMLVRSKDGFPSLTGQGYSNDGWEGPRVAGYRSRGTDTVPQAVVNDDTLLWLDAWGYDGDSDERSGRVLIKADGTVSDGIIPSSIRFDNTDALGVLNSNMIIKASGKVGVGTTEPDTKLHVDGTLKIANGGETCSAAGDAGMFRYNAGNMEFCNGSSWSALGTGNGSGDILDGGNSKAADLTIGTNDNYDLNFETNGSTQFKIQNNGRVGLGTVAPASKFEISGTSAAGVSGFTNISSFTESGLRIKGTGFNTSDAIAYQSGNNGGGAAVQFGRGAAWDTYMAFSTNSAANAGMGNMIERMRIDDTGNVGIGTSSPEDKLHIVSDSSPGLHLSHSATDNGLYIGTPDDNEAIFGFGTDFTFSGGAVTSWTAKDISTGVLRIDNGEFRYFSNSGLTSGATYTPTERFNILSDGRVGVGVVNPLAKLHVSGAVVGAIFSSDAEIGILPGEDFEIVSVNSSGAITDRRFIIDTSGDAGFGVTSPDSKLDVAGRLTSSPAGASSGDGGSIVFKELAANGTHSIGFRAPDALTASTVLELPDGDGSINQVLQTNGSGVLSWVDLPSALGGDFTDGGDTAIADMVIGTNNSFDFSIETNGASRAKFEDSGKIRFGNDSAIPSSTNMLFDVDAVDAYLGTAIEFNGDVTSASNHGTYMEISPVIKPSGASSNTYMGVKLNPKFSTSSAVTSADYTAMHVQQDVIGSTSIDDVKALTVYNRVLNTAVVDDLYGIFVTAPFKSGTATISDDYFGIYVDGGSSPASGDSWAIYTDGEMPSTFRGNLGLRDLSPDAYLEIANEGTAAPYLMLSSEDYLDGDVVIVNNSGDVGIGDSTPSDKLQVAGDIRVGTSGSNGCLKDFGGLSIAGTCSSDIAFKKNIEPVGSVLNKLTQLQPSFYNWRVDEFPEKNFGHRKDMGLIAQQVVEVIPDLVTKDEDGYYQVHYQRLKLYNLQAIIEQQQQVEAHKKYCEVNLSQLNQKVSGLQFRGDQHDRRLSSLESSNMRLEEENKKLKNQLQELLQQNSKMNTDLEKIKSRLNL